MKKMLMLGTALLLLSTTAIGNAWAQATNSNPLSDPRVRQAIAYAIDMDTIVDTLFDGKAIRAVGLLPDGPNKPDDLERYDYNPDRARELLAAAGWDSSRELDVVYYYADQTTDDLMAAIQAYLADVGISMQYRKLEGDIGAQTQALPADPVSGPTEMTWDILYGARAALALQEYFNQFGAGLNPTVPNDPEMIKNVALVNGTTDPDVQREGFHAMERINNKKAYLVPLYYQQLYTYESNRLHRNGEPYGNEQYNYNWGVENWTVDPTADGKDVMYTNAAPSQFFEVPWQNLGIWVQNKFVFDTVLEADGNLKPIGGELADSYSVSDDGLDVSFTLKDGLTWHDGTPLTADDLAWSIGAALKFPITHPVLMATFKAIAGAEAFQKGEADTVSGISVEGNTVKLKFDHLDPNVLLTFTQFAPLPKAQFAGADPIELQQAPYWQKPIGSGPFMIDEARMNDYTTLVPFPAYHKGAPKIAQIIARPSGDNDGNLLVNATAGKADFGYTKAAGDVAGLEALSYMKVTPIDIPYTRMLWINEFPHASK